MQKQTKKKKDLKERKRGIERGLPDYPGCEQPGAGMSGRGWYPSPRSSVVPPRPEGRGLPRFDEGDGLLEELFEALNERHFDAFLDQPKLRWNARFRTCSGRFTPPVRRGSGGSAATLEVARYLWSGPDALEVKRARVQDALGHEMIHYWLWLRGLDYGHTAVFYDKMRAMGVSRYSQWACASGGEVVQRVQQTLRIWVYRCVRCQQRFESKAPLGALACLACCQRESQGQYDPRFLLVEEPDSGRESV